MVIVGTSRLTHPTTSCSRRADRPRAGPTWELRSVVPAVIRCSLARPRGRAPWYLRGGTEDVDPERTGLQGGAASGETQRSDEGPASLRCVQALRGGVHGGAPAGEPPPWVGDQGPVPHDDTQKITDRRAFPAPHTRADRRRRFGHR